MSTNANDSGITPLTPEQTSMQEQQAIKEGYLKRVLIGFDQFVNVVTKGQADETISSRAARAAVQGKWWGRTMSKALDKFQPDHGAKAEAGDTIRAINIERIEETSGNINQVTVTQTTTTIKTKE